MKNSDSNLKFTNENTSQVKSDKLERIVLNIEDPVRNSQTNSFSKRNTKSELVLSDITNLNNDKSHEFKSQNKLKISSIN